MEGWNETFVEGSIKVSAMTGASSMANSFKTTFGIPIRLADVLLLTESRLLNTSQAFIHAISLEFQILHSLYY